MVQPLSGLQTLAGQEKVIEENAQATAEQRSGNPVDPRHAKWGEQASPYPWQSSLGMGSAHGPYGLENGLLDDDYWWSPIPAGDRDQAPYMDRTPYLTHGGPKPKGILSGPVPGATPDDIADQLAQSREIHGIRTNAGVRHLVSLQGLAQNDQWADFYEYNPGETNLQPLSRQQMSSHFMFGSRDRTQTMSRQNEHGFDTAHMHRRWATGSIPGNTYWMRPGGRVMVKNIPTVARPAIGEDSPFTGDSLFNDFDPHGAILMATPGEYVPPPQPNLGNNIASNPTGDSGAVVEWY